MDARSKIINKNRVKIRDARDKISENARKTIKDARELLTSSRKPIALRTQKKVAAVPRVRQTTNTLLVEDDDDFDMNALSLKPVGAIKRTVRNEMFRKAPPSMPRMPKFSFDQEVSRLSPDPFDCYEPLERRPIPLPAMRPERVERFHPSTLMRAHMDSYEPRKSILRSSRADDHDDRFDNDRYFPISSTDGVRSRLYGSRDRNESEGIFAKLPVRGTSPPPAQIGHRIVISNLHNSVSESDVRELFEDVGPLVTANLVRPGIAEVVYKNLGDAEEAVETYHNRQLDGQPMKCMLVRSSAKPSYSRL